MTTDSSTRSPISRRAAMRIAAGVAFAGSAGHIRAAHAAAPKFTILTNWFAQAEHGGFYQAVATELYKKAGLDVTVKMGGPQVNNMQLLTAGEADMILGYDIQTLNSIEKGLPVTTVAASFQFDLQGIMTHEDINSLADLKGRKILIASSSHVTFWPWLVQRFGYTDDQAAPYTFNLQPFLVDPKAAVQSYPSSEPYEAGKMGAKVKFFLFADDGYPPYGTSMIVMQPTIDKRGADLAKLVRASLEGWKSYIENPAPGNVLIQKDNPQETQDRIDFAVNWLRAHKVVNGRDAATQGVGIMTDARWQQTHDFLVKGGLLKASTDYKKAFTTKFVKDLHIMLA